MEISSFTLSTPRSPSFLHFQSSQSTFLFINGTTTLSFNKTTVNGIALVLSRSRTRTERAQKSMTCNAMFGLGMPELVVIASVAALIFGPKKLPEMGNPIFVQLFFSDPNSAGLSTHLHHTYSSKQLTGKVRILSIDAAGATDGILAANALTHLESSLHRNFGDPKAAIFDFFDVVSGSGAQGILAALLFTRGLKDGSTRSMFTTKDAPLSSSSSAS